MKRLKYIILLVFGLQISIFIQSGQAKEIAYSNHEIIRNGSFEEDYRSWYSINCSPSPRAAKSGKYGMYMSGIGGEAENLTFFQNIIIPSRLTAASISYDYRVRQWADNRQAAELKIIIGKSKGFESADFANIDLALIEPIKTVRSDVFDTSIEWQHIQIDLNQNILSAIQAAHESGFFVFLQFLLTCGGSKELDLNVHIDNLSMKINGIQKVPQLNGTIAYIGRNPNHHRDTINLLDPNDSRIKTIWTYPDKKQKYPWKNLKWRPDSAELAFISDFETPFSPTYTNIYSIDTNGQNLRKISNPPLQKEILNGNYPTIKVTGKIKSTPAIPGNKSPITAVDLWIQGAKKTIPLKLKPNDTTAFEIEDVAVIGDNQEHFEPVVVLHWSNAECAYGVEYERPISDIASSKTDIGVLVFEGLVCNEGSEVNSIRNMSWNWDGSQIGFAMIGGLRKIDPKGQSIFMTKELMPFSNVKWPDHMAWSPIDHHYLYYDYDLPSMQNSGLYLAAENDESELLINDAKSATAAWLPDGKGFLYIRDAYEDKNIYRYDLQTKEKKRLTYFSYESIENISISGDGQHLVFELRNNWVTPIESNLWIMDLISPTEMWQITWDGKSSHPDWSKTEVDLNAPSSIDNSKSLDRDDNTKNTDKNNENCFISNIG